MGNQLLLVHILLTESSATHASVLPRAQREPLLRGPLEMHLEEEQLYLLRLSAIMKGFESIELPLHSETDATPNETSAWNFILDVH